MRLRDLHRIERQEASARGVSVARLRDVARERLGECVAALGVKEPG